MAYTPISTENDKSQKDAALLSSENYAMIQQLKQEYERAKAAGDRAAMNAAHERAEQIRAQAGYQSGVDGSQYLPMQQMPQPAPQWQSTPSPTPQYTPPSPVAPPTPPPTPDFQAQIQKVQPNTAELKALLEQWKAAAEKQNQNSVDYAVQQAVTELERAKEDAQPLFKSQAESVAKDERQAMDNAALYAEARGDKGGIGQEQYNEIQATAAQNRMAVQQAQTKLSTDTARQIADLRAKGEFEKADAALEVAQKYLSQLMSLEQWAAEYNMSAAQFEAQLQQWQAEFDSAWSKYVADFNLEQQQFNSQQTNAFNQWQAEFDYKRQQAELERQAELGKAMLSAGLKPSAQQLAAMGMTEEQAGQYITALQLQQAAKEASKSKGSGGGGGGDPGKTGKTDLFTDALAWSEKYGGRPEEYIAAYYKDYGYSNATSANSAWAVWQRENPAGGPQPAPGNEGADSMSQFDQRSIQALGIGSVSLSLLDRLMSEGKIQGYTKNGKVYVGWAKGWGPINYLSNSAMPTPPTPSSLPGAQGTQESTRRPGGKITTKAERY